MRTTSARATWRRLSREWEIVVFWLALGIGAVALVARSARRGQTYEPVTWHQPIAQRSSLLKPGALAFLEPMAVATPTSDGAFGAFLPPRDAAKTTLLPTPRTVEATAPVAVASTAARPAPTGPPAVAAALPRTRRVEYCGMMTTRSGKTVAFVKSQDPATAAEQTEFLAPGGTSAQGIRVCGFDDQALCVASASGAECRIPMGESGVITLD